MIAVIGLLLGFLVSALFLIQGKRRRTNDNQEKKRSSSEPVEDVVRPKSYSKSEVAVHNKRNDCWIIIKDKVYDITSYVEEHPGGDAILDHAGDDSTDGFFGPQHATRVFDMIEDFYIGELH
ncbi:Putative Cytochrome B5 [Arabidopsis thaliana]|jgi:cytochrome b involved in lipid metabolism|uniref:Cytochrome B5-like protein n=3 Tax=Arabidopsis TaxID=3701 RepID=CYP5F_ARATH|nr:cytochrome B5-like protein [Arabidopsis thaliana]O22704.1 RecName: Full=Cytochrome B5-like protein; Short=AtCb5LP; AltName: Full=Cytochrome b5 isoform F; Short=AtCb5-F [Arabidopsis thaliana]KAG7657975.1 Cytochrome b5-like heme/steroid binding domain superfamily [Arabidopsis suecica]AAB71978.1 Putative Cytochrome B5 [Arabidopsis thaliana]AAK83639.1 At1g60660/F8A5_18 [Arabidopsis thaliana]AAM91405.1 At1g60660/F8A5_18 [Arabidopsis thaliana]AEE33716.1 cytochrome B5-like protein [Arabidopsis th|eukprot:NP_176265.1 cytochrome B5-like protein [Arabidopsis thaliana]